MNKENDFKNDFFTKEQLQECIDINIGSIITKLDNYIYYDGILTDSGRNEDLYVTGFIKIKPFFFDTYIDDRGEEHHIHSYVYKCGAYCSRPELSNNEDLTPDRFFNTNYATIYYYYHDFVDYCAQLRLPIKDIAEKDDFSFGMPSGHAQASAFAATFWILYMRKKKGVDKTKKQWLH